MTITSDNQGRLSRAARQERILSALDAQPAIRVAELAERTGVSTETIRRDLDQLEAEGALKRTYGGAVRGAAAEPGVTERHGLMPREREALARAAIAELNGAKTILIGSGATTVHVARRIAYEMRELTVITHAFGVATVLSANPTISVLLTPGLYHAGEGAVHGAATLRFLEDWRADWAICGASGANVDGPTDALSDAAEVYAAMFRRADRRMVVADHKKFGHRYPARYARWADVDVLASDQQPAGPLATEISARSVQLAVASPNASSSADTN